MLNKTVCRKCYQNGFYASAFEEHWRHKHVLCAVSFKESHGNTYKTTEDPPLDCPYLTEHLVNRKK